MIPAPLARRSRAPLSEPRLEIPRLDKGAASGRKLRVYSRWLLNGRDVPLSRHTIPNSMNRHILGYIAG